MAKLHTQEIIIRLKNAIKLAKSLGGDFLSTSYNGVDTIYKWRCSSGHEWQASYYSVVQRGSWCGKCSGRNPDKNEKLRQARDIAKKHSGKCLSDEYKNSTQKLKWRCIYGHKWEANFSNTSKGKWCPWCAGNKVDPEIQLQNAIKVSKELSGQLLSTSYVSNKAPMRWKCSQGHEWQASYYSVVQRGSWCGKCRGTQREKDEQLTKATKVAESKFGQCLNNTYTNNSNPMEWKCKRGHKWNASYYAVVQGGSWCPICSTGLNERLARHVLEQLFGASFKKQKPEWLKNPITGRSLELDGLNSELNLAFEYQGPQHYKIVLPFKMSQRDLEYAVFLDNIKKELCSKNGIILMEIPYTVEPHDFPEWIHTTIEKIADNTMLTDKMKSWRELELKEWLESEQYSISDLRLHAKLNGGYCLSKTYLGSKAKHRWSCSGGHKWESTWDSINNRKTWCPVCCGNIILDPLQELQNIANSRGGKILSDVFLGMQKKHRWQCSDGHEWETRPSHIKTSNSWCPICALKRRSRPRQKQL